MDKQKVGVLTGGGDCPGLNAAIRAVTRKGIQLGYEIIGIKDGWRGLLDYCQIVCRDGELIDPMLFVLKDSDVSGILNKGGTILGSSRTNPVRVEDGRRVLDERITDHFKRLGLYALIAIGGDDTLGVAVELKRSGLNVVGVPKTIDNDVGGTDYSIGFDTAVSKAVSALDDLHSTAEAHHRVIILEVMGRSCGAIASAAGYAGGADCILIPETPAIIEEVEWVVNDRYKKGKNFSLIVVGEGVKIQERTGAWAGEYDSFGHKKLGGVGQTLAEMLKARRKGLEVRAINLGHLLRGGAPLPRDRIIASRFGYRAIELVHEGKFGLMVSLRGEKVTEVPLEESQNLRTANLDLYKEARELA